MSQRALNPEQFQGQLFDPDNPPLGFSKEEVNANLAKIKEGMRQTQLQRAHAHNLSRR